MDYWNLHSFIIQFLLAMGLANNHDRELGDDNKYLKLRNSIEIQSPEKIIGATFHNEESLLIYSETLLTIVDLTNSTPPVYKYIDPNFKPRKLMKGFTESELLLLSTGWHCIRQLNINNRTLSVFSGNCTLPGFVDGNKYIARYHFPSDMERAGEYFYIADYNNDCIRSLWADGSVRKIVFIHSRPFELAGSLYVAANQKIYKIIEHFNTYVQFVADVNTTTMELCDPDTLSMLSADKYLTLFPLSSDTSTQSRKLNTTFNGLICDRDSTVVTKLKSSTNSRTTMQLYTVYTRMATGQSVSTTQGFISSSSTLKRTDISTSTSISQTKAPTTQIVSRKESTDATEPATVLYRNATTVPAGSSNLSTSTIQHNETSSLSSPSLFGSSSTIDGMESPPRPLNNHAHGPFDHLPKSYTQENKSLTVIIPIVLSILTVVVVLITLACIIKKRSKQRLLSENMRVLEDEEDDSDENITSADDSNEEIEHSRCLIQTDLSCHFFNNTSSNGHIKTASSEGHTKHSRKLNGTSTLITNGTSKTTNGISA